MLFATYLVLSTTYHRHTLSYYSTTAPKLWRVLIGALAPKLITVAQNRINHPMATLFYSKAPWRILSLLRANNNHVSATIIII